MTAPLSGAFGGFNYEGAFGNDASSFANAAARFVQGRREEEERKQKAALDAALRALEERKVAQGDTRIQLDRDQLGMQERELGMRGSELAGKQVQFGEEHNLNRDKLAQVASEGEKERANRLKIAMLEAQQRAAAAAGSPRALQFIYGPKGEILLGNKIEGTVAPTQAVGGAGVPTNPAGNPVGAGARPDANERQAAEAFGNLQSSFDMLKQNMAKVNNEAPGVGTQLLLDASKSTGLGPISSLTRSLSNTALGNTNPEYQQIQQSVDALGTMVVKMVTGAQMSEPEAQRIMNILRTVAGDTPEVAQQKLDIVQEIINNSRAKLGRAAGLVGGGAAPAPSAKPKSPAERWEELVDGGMSPDAATAKVKQEMGQ